MISISSKNSAKWMKKQEPQDVDATHFQRLGYWTEKADVSIPKTTWAEGLHSTILAKV